MNDQDKQFIDRARKVLDESVEQLDGDTRAALTRARARALDRPRHGIGRYLRIAVPAVALALAAVLLFFREAPLVPVEKTFVHDLGLLASEDPIEFYEEIEFCLWLAEGNDEDPDFSHAPALPAENPLGPGRGTDRPGRGAARHGAAGVSRII
ncbi:MAG: hypothetical protein R2940_17880 [Syntrophotaleaceae bacterium]